ncbi:MAG: Gfo/Idh/MocA family oxidoreductase [Deltaproteobacteria bacterium]|nr:Gfo/Idh/MocA family oxidoreductase [Deltaproteobacteria bacterium]
MTPLRIGLVGAGMIGSTHSAVLQTIAQALPEAVELTAVADPDAAARERLQGLSGWRHAYADHAALLAGAPVDAVFVCTPTAFHAEIVRDVAAAGRHLFAEKPLAMSLAEARAMQSAVARAGVRAQIGLVLRFSAVYGVMRALLREADAGAPMAVVFRDDQCFPIRGLHDTGWRADRRLTAGGTLIEHGVHDLDLLTWLFGPVATLRAWSQNRAGHAGIEDYVAVELAFASGLRAQLVNVWHDMAQRTSNRRLEIFCPRAFLASEADMSGSILLQRGDGAGERLAWEEVHARFTALLGRRDDRFREWYGVPYLLQDLSFIEALRAGRDPNPGLAVGVEAQRLAAAVYAAAESGSEIELARFGSASDER